MPSSLEEAVEHVQKAEKALKTSWASLKFSADLLTATLEYTNAATKYRAAGKTEWRRGEEDAAMLGAAGVGVDAFIRAGAYAPGDRLGRVVAASEGRVPHFRGVARQQLATKRRHAATRALPRQHFWGFG